MAATHIVRSPSIHQLKKVILQRINKTSVQNQQV